MTGVVIIGGQPPVNVDLGDGSQTTAVIVGGPDAAAQALQAAARAETAAASADADAAAASTARDQVLPAATQVATDAATVATQRAEVLIARDQSVSSAASAAAAASTTSATVANAAVQRETLAALETAMAASATDALGVVFGLNADEGVYRKPAAGPLVRVSDTQRQIGARSEAFAFNAPGADAFVFSNTDSGGVVREIARISGAGVATFAGVRGETIEITNPPYPVFEQYEMLGSLGPVLPVFDTDSGGISRIVGYIPTSPVTSGGSAGSTVPEDDIRAYVPAIDQTGTIDVSGLIKSAHDAAQTAGRTTMYLEAPYLAPTAMFLGNVHFRTRSGRGQLIGTYRKQVLPANLPSLPALPDLVPERHLARFSAAVAAASPSNPAVLAYMSDSWGNANQLVGLHSQFEYMLRRALRLQYGEQANRILVVNRALGGSTWDDAAGTPTALYSQVTWAPTATPWLNYVTSLDLTALGLGSAVKPHLCMAMFGMNHGVPASATTLNNITTVLNALAGISPTPDVVLVAGTIPSTMHPTRGTKDALEARLSMAGLVRSEAAMRGWGLVDFGRIMGAVHWGQDERLTYFRRVVQNVSVEWPYTYPQETVDFACIFQAPGQTNTFWTTGDGVLSCTLSSVPGNRVVLERDGPTGNVAVTVFAGTGVVSIPRFVTAVAAATGAATPRVEICAQGPHLTVRFRNVILLDGPVHRGGGQHAPVIGFGGGSITLDAVDVAVSEFSLVEPSLTAIDLWGATNNGALGGNGASADGNHLSEPGRAAIFGRGLLGTRWS